MVVALRVKRRALLAGLDPARLSGHSLRLWFHHQRCLPLGLWLAAGMLDEPAGLVRLYDTRRLGANRLLEAAGGSEGLRPENAVHRPWVIP